MTRTGIWLIFFGGLVAMNTAQGDAYALPKMVALGLGLALIWAGACTVRRTFLDGPVLALWVVALASTTASGDWPTAVFGIYGQPYHGLLAMALCTLALYAGAAGGRDLMDGALRPLSAAVVVMGLVVAAQMLGIVPERWAFISGRVISTSGSPVFLGGVLAVILPLLIPGGWVAVVATGLVLPATEARGAMIAAACGVGVFLFLMRWIELRRAVLFAAIVAVLAGGATMWRGEKNLSDTGRIAMWGASARAIAVSPYLGYGPDCFLNALRANRTPDYVKLAGGSDKVQSSAHNDIVQVAVTLGIFGLIAYLWAMLRLWRCARHLYEVAEFFRSVISTDEYRYSAAAVGCIVAALVQAKVNPLPIEAMVIASFAAGYLTREDQAFSPWSVRAMRAASCVVAFSCAQMCIADIAMARGVSLFNQREFVRGAQMVRAGVNLAPWEINFVARRCEEIYLLAPRVSIIEARDFMRRALRASLEMRDRRPLNSSAHELVATTCWKAAPYLGRGLLWDARRAIIRAQELDPLFQFSEERRRQIEHDIALAFGRKR